MERGGDERFLSPGIYSWKKMMNLLLSPGIYSWEIRIDRFFSARGFIPGKSELIVFSQPRDLFLGNQNWSFFLSPGIYSWENIEKTSENIGKNIEKTSNKHRKNIGKHRKTSGKHRENIGGNNEKTELPTPGDPPDKNNSTVGRLFSFGFWGLPPDESSAVLFL